MTSTDAADALRELEPIFHRSPAGADRAVYERLIGDEFWEIGASGSVYSREHVLDALTSRPETPHDADWVVDDFAVRHLGDDLWLVTYALTQDRDRNSRRTTLWRSTDDGWRAEFHQGTLV